MRIATLVALAALFSRSASAQQTLSCESVVGRTQVDEAPHLLEAPKAASRPTEHRLAVPWAKGTREFVDQPPYGEGDRYLYCGFNRELGWHLIYKLDQFTATGVILDNATGQYLPGGKVVIVAPNALRYFASFQSAGAANEDWHIYARTGGLLWKGRNDIRAFNPRLGFDAAFVEFSDPHWSADNTLQVTAKCVPGGTATFPVSLRNRGGDYTWSPTITCPKAK